MTILPTGKLPPKLLGQLLNNAPVSHPRVRLGPGVGLDCGVIETNGIVQVFKTEPITFATDQIGWYAVQVAVNDIVTTGATPRWIMLSLLLPEGKTTPALVETIGEQIFTACRLHNLTVLGGHTEITTGLDRPILVATVVGETTPERLITPQGAQVGNKILLTKSAGIEATAILAREMAERLQDALLPEEIEAAQNYLYEPGISVWKDAQIAQQAGRVTAMHDPTEGGIVTALWELAEASDKTLQVKPAAIPISPITEKLCNTLKIDPLAAISSGALLMTAAAEDSPAICRALAEAGIACAVIGDVNDGPADVQINARCGPQRLYQVERDEVARLFETPMP
ncbi:MAG TPA: AIR synthase family protein [Anaerolineaceae bacterium]|nr:AIR synthase family protein [Anaerolineaceae bacterium]HNS36374.1 AIR synthase family protein [Anaerolineaceae bacterium]